ncbi:hypothetical protein ACC703_38585, partial [Rhizobium ruizarguesonis]
RTAQGARRLCRLYGAFTLALDSEGKELPDNSLIVGAPARVVRVLDEAAAEAIRRSAESYIANWQRFARDLRQIG